MTSRYAGRWTVVFAAGFVCALLITGCANEEEAKEQNVKVDPRFATPEALAEQYNGMIAQQSPDLAGVLELVYTENRFQQRILSVLKSFAAMLNLHTAVEQQFGTGLIPDSELEDLKRRAKLDERNGRRATASIQGDSQGLELVQYDRRWWISGYTFENDPSFSDNDDFAMLEKFANPSGRIAASLSGRVRAGEFNSVKHVQQTFANELLAQTNLSPQELQDIPDFEF